MCFARGVISSIMTFKKQIEWIILGFVHVICFRKCQTFYPIVMENILQYYTLPAAQNHPRQTMQIWNISEHRWGKKVIHMRQKCMQYFISNMPGKLIHYLVI